MKLKNIGSARMSNSAKNADTRVNCSMVVATAEECRSEIVKWLRDQATRLSSQARIATHKRVQATLKAQVAAYDDAANFINRIEIKPPLPLYTTDLELAGLSIDDLIKDNKIIVAIRKRRMDTGETLMDAKNYVVNRRAELGLTD